MCSKKTDIFYVGNIYLVVSKTSVVVQETSFWRSFFFLYFVRKTKAFKMKWKKKNDGTKCCLKINDTHKTPLPFFRYSSNSSAGKNLYIEKKIFTKEITVFVWENMIPMLISWICRRSIYKTTNSTHTRRDILNIV